MKICNSATVARREHENYPLSPRMNGKASDYSNFARIKKQQTWVEESIRAIPFKSADINVNTTRVKWWAVRSTRSLVTSVKYPRIVEI